MATDPNQKSNFYSNGSNPPPPPMNVVNPPGQPPYGAPYAQPGGSGAGMGASGYNPSFGYNPTLATATNSAAPIVGAGGRTTYEKLYFHTKKLLTLRIILKIMEVRALSFPRHSLSSNCV